MVSWIKLSSVSVMVQECLEEVVWHLPLVIMRSSLGIETWMIEFGWISTESTVNDISS